MYSCYQLLQALENGQCDPALAAVYTQEGLGQARARAICVAKALQETYSPRESAPAALISGPGRTEIGGNHTDHQRGRGLAHGASSQHRRVF